jgi:hypothetical protein
MLLNALGVDEGRKRVVLIAASIPLHASSLNEGRKRVVQHLARLPTLCGGPRKSRYTIDELRVNDKSFVVCIWARLRPDLCRK